MIYSNLYHTVTNETRFLWQSEAVYTVSVDRAIYKRVPDVESPSDRNGRMGVVTPGFTLATTKHPEAETLGKMLGVTIYIYSYTIDRHPFHLCSTS
jgi:hypothetical protein